MHPLLRVAIAFVCFIGIAAIVGYCFRLSRGKTGWPTAAEMEAEQRKAKPPRGVDVREWGLGGGYRQY